MEKSSAEQLFSKQTHIFQPEDGYRFSIDPFVLAAHVHPKAGEKIVDIGTGCGIIPLILSSIHPLIDIVGVEIQKELYQFASKNQAVLNLEKRICFINKDISEVTVPDISGPADRIVSNPPYKKRGSGRLNPNSQKAIARHEIHLDVDLLFKSAQRLLKNHGHLHIIFPAERLADLIFSMIEYQFCAKSMRFIHTQKNSPAKRVILCAVKNQTTVCTISHPLYILTDNNTYSREYLSLFKA